MNNKNLGFLASSVDPSQLAATVQGLIVSFTSLIILVAASRGFTLVPEQIQLFAGQVGLIVGVGYTLFGLTRKLIVWIRALWVNRHSNLG